nr:PREDICTED: oocyte zinc finger protein XlCOF6-like [Paralichthys olivaceus]
MNQESSAAVLSHVSECSHDQLISASDVTDRNQPEDDSERDSARDQSVSETEREAPEVAVETREGFALCSGDKDDPTAAEKPHKTCRKQFRARSHLCQKAKKHQGGVKPYKCVHCRKRFTFQSPLILHLRSHSVRKPFVCPVCGMNFYLLRHVKSHMTAHDIKTSVMSKVQEELETNNGLINSRGEWDPSNSAPASGLDLSSRQPQDATSEKMQRIQLVELTPTIAALDHSPAPEGKTPKQLESEDEQSLENPSVEPKQYQGPHRPKKKANCPTCGKVFCHNSALRRHLVIHSGKKPFKCFICGRGFTQSGNLKTHMKVHKGEVKIWTLVRESPPKAAPVTVHVCGECGMEFPQKQQLEEHRDTHKKPYACPDCTKTFKNKYYFKMHTRTHAGDTTFLCSECGKSCMSAGSLRKHELTHTGEKNFHCVQCGRTFAQSSHLNVHLKTHTGERPHLCSICGKSYARASALKVHLRVHTGEKPYTCDKCGKCFHYDQGYRKHLKNHNKKPKPPTKPLGRPKQQPLVVNKQCHQ